MIEMAAGETLFRDVTVFNDVAEMEPRNITGAAVKFEVLTSPNGDHVLDGQTAIINPTGGQIVGNISSVQTMGMPFRVLWFNITLTESDGGVSVVDSGKLIINSRTS